MSRSTYVYVVESVEADCSEVKAAFTVKHELETWLRRRGEQDGNDLHNLYVTRLQDGGDRPDLNAIVSAIEMLEGP
jgi:hypothetical protein